MTDTVDSGSGVDKIATGIPGFDIIADGGLPRGRATLVAGTAGSAKTIFSAQFLAAGIRVRRGRRLRHVRGDARRHPPQHASFGWDIAAWEQSGKWAFVDASPEPGRAASVVGAVRPGRPARAHRARREARECQRASRSTPWARCSCASAIERCCAPSSIASRGAQARRDDRRVHERAHRGLRRHHAVRHRGVRRRQRAAAAQHPRGREAPAHDRDPQVPRRAAPARAKFRSRSRSEGVVVIPLSAQELTQRSIDRSHLVRQRRARRMCNGGFFRDSIVLVSGATGTGKTLLVTQFLAGGFTANERCLLFAFEESRDQLIRNALAWGVRLRADGARGPAPHRESVSARDADGGSPPPHGRDRREFQPQRVAVDSLSALERVFTLRAFREFVISLTSCSSSGDRRPVHVDDAIAAGRRVDHREAHLDAHRLDHPAALRRDVRRDAARHDGAQDARLRSTTSGSANSRSMERGCTSVSHSVA